MSADTRLRPAVRAVCNSCGGSTTTTTGKTCGTCNGTGVT